MHTQTGVRAFESWITTHHVPPSLRFDVWTLLLFVTYLVDMRDLAAATARRYLSAVRSQAVDDGLPPPNTTHPTILRALAGAERLQSRFPDRYMTMRWPATFTALRTIMRTLDPAVYENRLFRAAATFAAAGMLRISELAVRSATKPDLDRLLRVGDVVANPKKKELRFTLRRSKTDQLGRGLLVIIRSQPHPPPTRARMPIAHTRTVMPQRPRRPTTPSWTT